MHSYIVVQGRAIILGAFSGVLPDFWVPFRAIPIFLGIILLVQFDFFRNNPDFWVLILIFYFKGYCGMLPAGLLFLIFFSQNFNYSCKTEWQ